MFLLKSCQTRKYTFCPGQSREGPSLGDSLRAIYDASKNWKEENKDGHF